MTLLLGACGQHEASSAPPASPPPVIEAPEPIEPHLVEPPRPAPEVGERRPLALTEAVVFDADVGGIVRRADVFVRFGHGPLAVFSQSDSARCTTIASESHQILPEGL